MINFKDIFEMDNDFSQSFYMQNTISTFRCDNITLQFDIRDFFNIKGEVEHNIICVFLKKKKNDDTNDMTFSPSIVFLIRVIIIIFNAIIFSFLVIFIHGKSFFVKLTDKELYTKNCSLRPLTHKK